MSGPGRYAGKGTGLIPHAARRARLPEVIQADPGGWAFDPMLHSFECPVSHPEMT